MGSFLVVPKQPIPKKAGIAQWTRGIVRSLAEHDGVNIEMTKACFLRCEHCYANASPRRNETLRPEAFEKILENLKELNDGEYPTCYTLTGGDPLKRPKELLAIVRLIEEKVSENAAVGIATTGLAAAEPQNKGLLKELAASPFVMISAFLYGFQREFLRKRMKLEAIEETVKRAYGTLLEIFGEDGHEIATPELENTFNEFREDNHRFYPFGRGASAKFSGLWLRRNECKCCRLWYSVEDGVIHAQRDSPIFRNAGKAIWVDHRGGLHLTCMLTGPLMDLAADKPWEKLDDRSLAVHLEYGGPLFAAQELLKMAPERIRAYYKEKRNCNLCYELRLRLHPELC